MNRDLSGSDSAGAAQSLCPGQRGGWPGLPCPARTAEAAWHMSPIHSLSRCWSPSQECSALGGQGPQPRGTHRQLADRLQASCAPGPGSVSSALHAPSQMPEVRPRTSSEEARSCFSRWWAQAWQRQDTSTGRKRTVCLVSLLPHLRQFPCHLQRAPHPRLGFGMTHWPGMPLDAHQKKKENSGLSLAPGRQNSRRERMLERTRAGGMSCWSPNTTMCQALC